MCRCSTTSARPFATTVDAAALINPLLTGLDTGADALRDALRIAATLVTSPQPPHVIFVHGWGDFDTHRGQLGAHGTMMRRLDAALAEFFEAITSTGAAERVIVMTTSEFGRRPAANGTGTDHGTAASQLVVGAGIHGGRFGEPTDLARLDARGNLRHTVDFRSYYASVLDGWFAAPATEILASDYEVLPLF